MSRICVHIYRIFITIYHNYIQAQARELERETRLDEAREGLKRRANICTYGTCPVQTIGRACTNLGRDPFIETGASARV